MVKVIVRLVDGENVILRRRQIELDPQIFIADLEKEIESLTAIQSKFQDVTFRGVPLSPDSLHPLESIKNLEEIVVKHTYLDRWRKYLDASKIVEDLRMPKDKRTLNAHEGIGLSEILHASGFFMGYTTYFEKWNATIGGMMRYVDRTEDILKEAATTFFSKMYPNSNIAFKDKEGGTRIGIVVVVTCHDETTNYYMKTYHHAGTSLPVQSAGKGYPPDLREMFAYRLLELIGVGPAVVFPFSTASTYIHYIATKEVNEFTELHKIEDLNLQKKIVVEAFLLQLILGIRDLNEGNIGSNMKKTLSIVDFCVPVEKPYRWSRKSPPNFI
ncbi:unnamed protein product, partial [Mesorhabditis spiculigera]